MNVEAVKELLEQARGALAVMRGQAQEAEAKAAELRAAVLHQEGAVAGIEAAVIKLKGGEGAALEASGKGG